MTSPLTTLPTNKYALSLHTTTPELGLALSNFAGETRANVWNLGRDLSSYVHQYLIDFIQPQTWADLAFISVAKGPGGFTGTRIGVVTARTLGQQLNIPVFAISTLAAIAWSQKGDNQKAIAIEMPAQRGKVFVAIYQPTSNGSEITAVFPDTVMTPEAWQETLATWNTDYQLISAQSSLARTVTSILELAYIEWGQGKSADWSAALPYYGQHPVPSISP